MKLKEIYAQGVIEIMKWVSKAMQMSAVTMTLFTSA
jgi:hypothetical protein